MPAWEAFEAEWPSSSIPSVSSLVSFSWKQGEPMHGVTVKKQKTLQSIARRALSRGVLCAGVLMLAWCLAASVCAFSQSAPSAGTTPTAIAAKPAVQPVTTTVIVHGEVKDNYLPEAVTVGTLDGETLKETPLSATVVTRDLLTDQAARVLSDVVKNDASIGEDYAPVGYYGDFEIRGFPIDLATGLQINGMAIAGEQDVPLENKGRVEIVKGIAGVESGVASAGGLINYVTKEPDSAQRPAIDLATDHRGTAFGALDVGHVFRSEYQPGIRLNLAGEDMHTYVQHADGWRGMGAADSELRFGPATALFADFDYQHKVQRSEAGYQLLGGTVVPTHVFPSEMLGYQSWSKPNTFDTDRKSTRLNSS